MAEIENRDSIGARLQCIDLLPAKRPNNRLFGIGTRKISAFELPRFRQIARTYKNKHFRPEASRVFPYRMAFFSAADCFGGTECLPRIGARSK